MSCISNEALGQLVVLSDCVCLGHELWLECTVVGGIATYWTGSAFDCTTSNNEIYLFHPRFQNGPSGVCNNGRIIAHSINVTTSDSDGIKYISQLIIQLDENGTLEGRTVECVHDNGLIITVIGMHTINYTRGINNY